MRTTHGRGKYVNLPLCILFIRWLFLFHQRLFDLGESRCFFDCIGPNVDRGQFILSGSFTAEFRWAGEELNISHAQLNGLSRLNGIGVVRSSPGEHDRRVNKIFFIIYTGPSGPSMIIRLSYTRKIRY